MIDPIRPVALFSIDELRDYVHETLCRRENLLLDQSPITELPLFRGGKYCGAQFIVQGPRALRLSAIWALDLNVIYFYDSKGERYLKLPLRHRLKQTADAA